MRLALFAAALIALGACTKELPPDPASKAEVVRFCGRGAAIVTYSGKLWLRSHIEHDFDGQDDTLVRSGADPERVCPAVIEANQ